ncbi:MAG: hypothetical protein U0270_02380 [Labilithrix sp.]
MSADWSWRARVPGILPGVLLRTAVAEVAVRLQMRIDVEIDDAYDAHGETTYVTVTIADDDGDDVEYTLLASQPEEDDDEFSLHMSTTIGSTDDGWDELMAVGDALAKRLGLAGDASDNELPAGPVRVGTVRCKIQLALEAAGGSASRNTQLTTQVEGAFGVRGVADQALILLERRIALALGAGVGDPAQAIRGWLEAHESWTFDEEEGENGTTFDIEGSDDDPVVTLIASGNIVRATVFLSNTRMTDEEALVASTQKLSRAKLGYHEERDCYYLEARWRSDMLTRTILEEEIEGLLEEARSMVTEDDDGTDEEDEGD